MDECMFTMLLMIQSSEFKKYIKLQGDYAVGSGFLSRFMITGVTSKRGHRSSVKNNSKSNTIRFHDRIKELLLLSEERYKNNEKHKYLFLSEEAQSALAVVYENIESRILKDNEKHPVVEGMLSKMLKILSDWLGCFIFLAMSTELRYLRETLKQVQKQRIFIINRLLMLSHHAQNQQSITLIYCTNGY